MSNQTKIRLRFLGLFCLLSVKATLSFAQSLEGRVVDAENPVVPVEGAVLYFIDQDVRVETDKTGKWIIDAEMTGWVVAEVSGTGYETDLVRINSDENKSITIQLKQSHRLLDRVIVSNNGVLQRESVVNVESVPLTDLNAIPNTTLGEALANIPGVTSRGIGAGLQKPVIRGLSGSRVVTYVNGLRIENQQWGADHGLPVTSLGIGSVEVIKGPASLLYGADALGGVVYFRDEPFAPQNTYSAYVQSRFEHNTMGTSNQAGFRMSKKAFKMNVYGGYDNFADYTLPNGNYVLNSRFKQSSAKVVLGYNRKRWVSNLRYNFYNGRLGLPGHTHDENPSPESFQTSTQRRNNNAPAQLVTNHFAAFENKFFLGRNTLEITVGNTYNGLREHEDKITAADIIVGLNNTLYNVKWKYDLTDEVALIAGSQGMFQINENGANAVEYLIPDATTRDAGIYALLMGKKGKWRFQAGGRIDDRLINAEGEAQDFPDFKANYTGFNYSAGLARLTKITTLRFNVSSGFRAPTTSELLSDGLHHGAARYEIGNSALKTEKALQMDASFAVHLHDFEVVINPFYNRINNYIYLSQLDSTVSGFPVYEYKQADFAQLFGTDLGIHYHPHQAHWLHFSTQLSSVFAEDAQRNPLPLIPQSRINTQVKLDFESDRSFAITSVVVQHNYFFKQNRVSILETETPAYHLLDAGINMQWQRANPIHIGLGVRNAFNQAYINHLSGLKYLGIQNPGINAYVSVRYEWSKNAKTK